ncbi:MAG: hypothetical protein ACRDPS_01450 [Nocardioides sp.]|uniref:hypothetical protein n=1 Tax=Nocardioides sp. TaxID=35761 RepID=UPI003D6AD95B
MTSLWFDDLNFLLADAAEEAAAIATDGFFFEAAGKDDGTELTNADAIVSTVTSDLFDGASHEVTGWESATLPLKVEIASPTRAGLDAGAARLIATCRKPGIRPLTLTPDGGAPTVYDVVIATSKHMYDDLESKRLHRRAYMLTLRCKPFPRSQTAVSLPGLAVGGAYSETVVATGAATTGWSTTSRYVTRRNLFLNPSFENTIGISPWTLYTNTSDGKVITDGAAPDPTKVARITADALSVGERSYLYSTVISVNPGQEYPFAVAVKAGHSGMTTGGVRVAWFDGSGNTLGLSEDISAAVTTSGYTTVSGSLTAPAGAVIIRAYPFVQAGSTVPAGQFWYFDAGAAIDLETVATTTFFDGDNAPSGGLTYYWGSGQGVNGVSIETGLGAVTASGGDVFPHGSTSTVPVIDAEGVYVNLTYTNSIDVSSHRFIRVKAKQPLTLELDGIPASHLASGTSGSYFVYHFAVPSSLTTTVSTAKLTAAFVPSWSEARLDVNEIATVSGLTTGTGRAVSRAVSLVGSMPAEATIEVTNNGNPLGDHLVIHSGSEVGGFTRLRAYRTDGHTQASNAASVSGFTSAMSEESDAAIETFQVPVSQLPEATYLFTVLVNGAVLTVGETDTFTYRASVIEDPGGTPVEHSVVTGTREFKATATTHPYFPLDLGLLNLPATHVAVSGTNSAVVQVQLWKNDDTGSWVIDEAWLADVDNGQISTIDFAAAGLSGEVTSLEIIPAAADRPQQQYLAHSGTAPNTTVREIIPTGWAAHRFDPADGDAQVNVINTATTPGLSVAIEFFPRWDVYAAALATAAEPMEA